VVQKNQKLLFATLVLPEEQGFWVADKKGNESIRKDEEKKWWVGKQPGGLPKKVVVNGNSMNVGGGAPPQTGKGKKKWSKKPIGVDYQNRCNWNTLLRE